MLLSVQLTAEKSTEFITVLLQSNIKLSNSIAYLFKIKQDFKTKQPSLVKLNQSGIKTKGFK